MAKATIHGLENPANVIAMIPPAFPRVHQVGHRRWAACQVRKRKRQKHGRKSASHDNVFLDFYH